MEASALEPSHLHVPNEPCPRCGTFADLNPFWGRRLCTACVEREALVLRGGGVSAGGLLSGLGLFPSRVWLLAAGLHVVASIPAALRSAAGNGAMRGLIFDILLSSVASAIVTYLGVEAVLGRKTSVREAGGALRRRFVHWFVASFAAGVWILGFLFLFVVPGIVKALSLALITPIALFEALTTSKEVLAKSTRRMKGARLSALAAYGLFFFASVFVAGVAGAVTAESTAPAARLLNATADLVGGGLSAPITFISVLLYVRLTPADALEVPAVAGRS